MRAAAKMAPAAVHVPSVEERIHDILRRMALIRIVTAHPLENEGDEEAVLDAISVFCADVEALLNPLREAPGSVLNWRPKAGA